MSANPKDPRTKRRQAAGDDPNKMSMAPQPLPGMPQDQKGGNVSNYPAFDSEGQMGQMMGSGGAMLPYGDMQADKQAQAALGNIGFTQVSGQPQFMVPGQGFNQMAYNSLPSPDQKTMEQMEPLYDAASAVGQTMPNGLNNGQPVSYDVTALGPTGRTAGMNQDPAMMSPTMSMQTQRTQPLQGVQSAEDLVTMNQGMSTGRGGGRNKGKK